MSSDPTLSVIVTTADSHGDFRRALESVRSQTIAASEVLIAGLPDNLTAQSVVLEFGENYRWIDSPANNVSFQRNAAIRHSRGDLIALLDANAVWSSQKLERSVAALTLAGEDDLVYTPAVFIDPNGTRSPVPDPELFPCGWILDELFEESWIVDSTVVFRREVWERHGGFNETLSVATGQNFYLRAARAHRFAIIPEALTEVYRAGSVSPKTHAMDVRETAEMLHRFYAEQGGDERLDSRRARKTLGELCEAAARLSWNERNIPMALRAAVGAMHYRRTWRSRLYLYWLLWRTRKERVGMVLTESA